MKRSKASVHDCIMLELPKIERPSGALTVLHGGREIPFDIKRVYYLYDVPGGAGRGGHAHKTLYQLIVAASGSFDIVLSDGSETKTVQLNRPYFGLLIPPGTWRDMRNFSSGAICLVLASEIYTEADYIRDYNEYLNFNGA
ncbi:MAG TPA: FdtA/QdtA family cupin domain-containing protein [Panacibacter sp.]|nr:FdtA/QdtA family cupin domain-containing protein [Panacibacter sp.]HNP46558.1 FdtA/QdtA family cupin domain-containing protein [Panacibacter sp.]